MRPVGGATGALCAAATAAAGAGIEAVALALAGAVAGVGVVGAAWATGVLTTPSVLLATSWRNDAAAIGSTDDDATLLATPMEFSMSKTSRGLTDNSFAIS